MVGENGYEVTTVGAFGSETYIDDKQLLSIPIVYLPYTETEVFINEVTPLYF